MTSLTHIVTTRAHILAFAYSSSIICTISSEQFYWYSIGYDIFGAALFYLSSVIVMLWAIAFFRVRSFPAVLLSASLYGLLVEGVITPLVYSGGLLDPVFVSWTSLGWHALFSVVLLWYFFRKWLVEKKHFELALWSLLLGLFIGAWSLTYALPENTAVAEAIMEQLSESTREKFDAALAADDPDVLRSFARSPQLSSDERAIIEDAIENSVWDVPRFAVYVAAMTALLMAVHLLLGKGLWRTTFEPGFVIGGFALAFLAWWYALFVVPAVPWAPLKLGVILTPLFIALWINRKREKRHSVLQVLSGGVAVPSTLPLALLPIGAMFSFWLGNTLELPDDMIRSLIFEPVPFILTIVGWVLFIYGLIGTLWVRKR